MKLYISKAVVLMVVITTGLFSVQLAADEIRDPEIAFFEESFGDMTEELAVVSDEGKTALLIMFETNDCPWCMRMKQTVLNHARVQDYYREHFKILKLNAEGGAPIVDFTGKEVSETEFATELLRVRATPVFAFYDTDGQLLTKLTGTTKDADEFLLLGEFVVGGHYQTQKFSQYRRAQKKASDS